jgi:hypothetical protein
MDYKNMAEMTNDELDSWMYDEPKEFVENLKRQIQSETFAGVDNMMAQKAESKKQQTLKKATKKTYADYAKLNPDFNKMWESGEIRKFMDGHPGLNAIAAHSELTLPGKIKAAVKKATKDREPQHPRHPADTLNDIAAGLKAGRQGRVVKNSQPNPENLDAQNMVETVD